jgi:hypothetical protein
MWIPPHELVDWTQIISTGLSLIALIVALYAVVKAKKDLVRERRLVHELELLQRIADTLRSSLDPRYQSPQTALALQTYLRLLPGDEDLPLTRAEVGIRPSAKGIELRSVLRDEISSKYKTKRIPDLYRVPEFFEAFEKELDEAIARRMSNGGPANRSIFRLWRSSRRRSTLSNDAHKAVDG